MPEAHARATLTITVLVVLHQMPGTLDAPLHHTHLSVLTVDLVPNLSTHTRVHVYELRGAVLVLNTCFNER